MQNPVGLKSIDHLEFTVDSLQSPTVKLFHKMGFQVTALAPHKKLFTQGQARFLVTEEAGTCHSRNYFNKHGEGVSKMSFQVESVEKALEQVLKNGAKLINDLKITETQEGLVKTAAIQGFGDVLNEFVERPTQLFREGFTATEDSLAQPLQTRVSRIDHLTNNVPKGEMEHWVEFYKRTYGFIETRYFDIKGKKTGLNSKVVQIG